jgi:hypothetical protein
MSLLLLFGGGGPPPVTPPARTGIEVYFDGVTPTDVTAYAYRVDINRGRAQEFDEINAGTCRIGLRNHTGFFVPYDDDFAPGRRVVVSREGVTVFDGVIDDWNFAEDPQRHADAEIEAVDALAELASRRFSAHTATPEERAGERLAAFLARAEVDYTDTTDFDRGVDRLQGNAIADGRNVLTEIQLIARTDQGAFFASREGVLRYHDRRSAATGSPSIDFTDDGSGTPFHGVQPDFGREFLYTRATVERLGGTVQTAGTGVRTLALTGLLLLTDGYAANLAEFLAATYNEPRVRIRALTIKLDDLSEPQREAVLELDLAELVTVTWTPLGSSTPIEQELVVEGIRHSHVVGSAYIVELQLSQRVQAGVFTLDSATLGVLDQDALAY